MPQTRRRFMTALPLAGLAGLSAWPHQADAEAPPEVTSIRFVKSPSLCAAPKFLVQELLRTEGFTEVQYVSGQTDVLKRGLGDGTVDFDLDFAPRHVVNIDRGLAITILGGVHVGCFDLIAAEHIRRVTDLRGKRIGISALESSQHMFLAPIAANVGIDPAKDFDWVVDPSVKPVQLFVEGKIDAFLGFPPESYELRAQKIGHVIFSSVVDRPWSHYFCCMLAGNREFVSKYPIATKRVTRAILKATDLCASNPELAARQMVDGGFSSRYDYVLQTLRELPYDKWREYDAEDTVRFYALRLRETGFIKSDPQTIISHGTNWRFLDELRRELKA
jgi:NitT/TauT family transport system substrate-binding protein